MGTKNEYLVTVNCAHCGKEFIPAPLNVFKKNSLQYCSWTCFNHRLDKPVIDYSKTTIFKHIRLASETMKTMNDIRTELESYNISIINFVKGSRIIETPRLIIRLIPQSMTPRGLLCDEAFGFSKENQYYLRRNSDTPPYKGTMIEYILEKEIINE